MAFPAFPVDDEVREGVGSNPEQLVVESCTISRWRGYVSSSFVALLEDGTPVAESASFRWRGNVAPNDDGPARKAYDGLQAELETLGWAGADARREVWYRGRFTRVVAVEAPTASAAAPRAFESPSVLEADRRPLHEAPAPPPAPLRVESPLEPKPPAETAPALSSVDQTAAEAPRVSRAVRVISVLGIVVAIAVGASLALGQGSHQAARTQAAPVSTAKPKRAASERAPQTASATQVPARPLVRPSVRLAIRTNNRASWLEVRKGSATGPVLFTGELAPGRTLHLAGKRLWGRFGAAGNLTINANGRRVRLVGTYDHLFVAAKP